MTVGTSNLVIFVIAIILVVGIIALILNKTFFKQLVIKYRGRTEEIARQDAATPQGATDYFNNAIREKETLYGDAERSYVEIAGKLDESEKEQYHLKKELMKIDKSINDCLDANDENGARQYAMKKITVQQKIDTLKDTIEEFKKAKDQQDEIRKAVKQELDELKEEKERTVYQMEADQQIIQLHEGMNASASSSESDHMLERVREGAKKTRERAAGAQIAYDTSAKAQDRRLEARARNREADELLAEMKRKRGNN